jgi:hypothetical protein
MYQGSTTVIPGKLVPKAIRVTQGYLGHKVYLDQVQRVIKEILGLVAQQDHKVFLEQLELLAQLGQQLDPKVLKATWGFRASGYSRCYWTCRSKG